MQTPSQIIIERHAQMLAKAKETDFGLYQILLGTEDTGYRIIRNDFLSSHNPSPDVKVSFFRASIVAFVLSGKSEYEPIYNGLIQFTDERWAILRQKSYRTRAKLEAAHEAMDYDIHEYIKENYPDLYKKLVVDAHWAKI
jgi:hypothetical protein